MLADVICVQHCQKSNYTFTITFSYVFFGIAPSVFISVDLSVTLRMHCDVGARCVRRSTASCGTLPRCWTTVRTSSWRTCTSAPPGCSMRSTSGRDTEPTTSSSRPSRKWSFPAARRVVRPATVWFDDDESNFGPLSRNRDPAILDCLKLTDREKDVLIDNINRRLTPQAVKIRAGNECSSVRVSLLSPWLLSITFTRTAWQMVLYIDLKKIYFTVK